LIPNRVRSFSFPKTNLCRRIKFNFCIFPCNFPSSGIRPFKCLNDKCTKTFTQKCALALHSRAHKSTGWLRLNSCFVLVLSQICLKSKVLQNIFLNSKKYFSIGLIPLNLISLFCWSNWKFLNGCKFFKVYYFYFCNFNKFFFFHFQFLFNVSCRHNSRQTLPMLPMPVGFQPETLLGHSYEGG
jgi:hypothetical protein